MYYNAIYISKFKESSHHTFLGGPGMNMLTRAW